MRSLSAIHRQWNFELPVTALAVNRVGTHIATALGDGSLRIVSAEPGAQDVKTISLHKGISLSLTADADEKGFLSGGDDGKIFSIDSDGATELVAEHKNKWIDHVTSSEDGKYRAYSAGKTVYLLDTETKQEIGSADLPSSAGGLAFSPNGKRLAASHYNGASLFWTNAKEMTHVKLPWKGSHLGVIWQPEGKIVLTSLQENALHGWRLSDMNEMRMQGYASKIHSMAFTAKGKYLATSGADQIICWPFFGGGPWGKTPLTLGGSDGRLVTQVAAHPKDELVAAGYGDGMIVMAPLDGRMEVMIHPPVEEKGSAIVGLGWNKEGDCLFAALESGYMMLFTVESVQKAVAHAAQNAT